MRPRHVVAIAVTDAVPVFEFAVPCEVFGIDRRDLVDPWYELRLCAAEPGPLRTTGGLRIETPYGLEDLLAADTVLVPACRRAIQREPPPELLDVLRRAHARGARMVSICSGAYLLAAAGLLDGRRATTHWMNAADLAHRFPAVKVDPDRALHRRGRRAHLRRDRLGDRPLPAPGPARPRRRGRQRGGPPDGGAAAPRRRPGPVRPATGAGQRARRPHRAAGVGTRAAWTSH